MNKNKIYVFDLDNTLCHTDGSNYVDSKPIIERIKKVNELYDDGHTIIVETARGCVSGKNWFYKTIDQLKSWNLKFHTLRTGVKFNGDIFVDDRAVNSEDFFSEGKSLNKESGSGVDTNVIIVSRVVKEATNERVDKLIDEMKFIESVPTKFKNKFPEIVFSRIENNKAFYEMRHYQLPTIRRLILSGDMDSEEIVDWSTKITNFSMEMHSHEKLDIPVDEYFKALHWDRFDNRMEELSQKSSWFESVLSEEDVSINGQNQKNITFLYHKLKERQKWFEPEFISRWSHSDLHFSNILIDRENKDFRLIDPRGYDFCDYYYDFGKLWHSVNSKYELIAARMFSVSEINEEHWFSLNQEKPYFALENSKDKIMNMFCKLSNQKNEDVVMKTEFNDVMHFATLIPFLLAFDNKEEKARVAYYQSVILMNDFCKKYGII